MNKIERVTIAGFGGQGVMMIGQLLAYCGNESELNSLWFPSYGPETRGGTANCSVTLSEKYINSPVFSKANTLMALNKPSLQRFIDKVEDGGIILYNKSLISDDIKAEGKTVYGIPMNDIAADLGNLKVANMVMMGAYLELTNIFNQDLFTKVLKKFLGTKKENLLEINIEAINLGRKYIQEHKK